MNRTQRGWLFALVLALLLSGAPQPAQAHGYIVRAIPEDRAVLERPPTRLQYWFSEGLEPQFSTLRVRNQQGEVIAEGGVAEDNTALMTVRLPSDLPDGAYVVELRPAFASDGHVIAESRVFFVGAEVGGVAGAAATSAAIPLEVVWKALVIPSSVLLFGIFTLYGLVLVPAWGSAKHRAGLLPPRVMRRLNVIVGLALLAAFAGNTLALIQQTMAFFNIDFVRALQPSFWSLVRIGSRFGDIWNFRMLFLGIVGAMFLASLYFRRSQPETVRAFWVASAWVMALVLGTFSILSHAAGSLLWPWIAITADWLHVLSVGFWAGGLAALVLTLPAALAPYEGEQRRLALLAALRRFSRVAALAVLVVITTGIYSAFNWIYTSAEVTSNFGLSLIFKVALVALLVSVGALHHIALRPERYARFQALTRRAGDLSATLRLEALLALAVLLAAGLLSATPVPTPEFLREGVDAPSVTARAADVDLSLIISPGGPGINTFDLLVERDGQRVADVDARLMTVYPGRDVRSGWHALEAIEDGLYVTVTDDINRAGDWWTLVDVALPGSDEPLRLAFDWDISAEAAVIQSVEPRPVNVLALLALVGALLLVIYPFARRLVSVLNLDGASVTIAIGATAATTVALVIGFTVIQETRSRYAETLNPPPAVVNDVLPTQDSLARGHELYLAYCINWQSVPRDFRALRDRLPRTRDDELFQATVSGWRGLPACAGDLSDSQRWDIVNYFRTLSTADSS